MNFSPDHGIFRLHNRLLIPSWVLLSAAILAGCGDGDPTAPGAPSGNVTLSVGSLDFGANLATSASTRSFTITADPDNAGSVGGRVSLADGSDAEFSLTEGAGDFALAPGESRLVAVRYRAVRAGTRSSATVELGSGFATIECRGFGTVAPYYEFIPTALSEGTVRTNYAPFAGRGVAVDYGTGRSHGASPNWLGCSAVARWIFNGNGTSESTVGYTFSVPSGVTGVTVTLGADIESDCVQTLIQIDGNENRIEDIEGCRTLSKSYSLRGGSHTIRVGTDQQGFCGGDLGVRSIRFEFQGILVPESQWVN